MVEMTKEYLSQEPNRGKNTVAETTALIKECDRLLGNTPVVDYYQGHAIAEKCLYDNPFGYRLLCQLLKLSPKTSQFKLALAITQMTPDRELPIWAKMSDLDSIFGDMHPQSDRFIHHVVTAFDQYMSRVDFPFSVQSVTGSKKLTNTMSGLRRLHALSGDVNIDGHLVTRDNVLSSVFRVNEALDLYLDALEASFDSKIGFVTRTQVEMIQNGQTGDFWKFFPCVTNIFSPLRKKEYAYEVERRLATAMELITHAGDKEKGTTYLIHPLNDNRALLAYIFYRFSLVDSLCSSHRSVLFRKQDIIASFLVGTGAYPNLVYNPQQIDSCTSDTSYNHALRGLNRFFYDCGVGLEATVTKSDGPHLRLLRN